MTPEVNSVGIGFEDGAFYGALRSSEGYFQYLVADRQNVLYFSCLTMLMCLSTDI